MNKITQALLAIVILLLISFLTLSPVLQNGWTNWDDKAYVLENEHIRDASLDNLLQLLKPENKTMDTYTPLTLVSFALEYSLVQYQPFLYHLDNLILHLLNILLVFFITKKLGVNIRIAFFVALLFGIHPMHVESVAWITERKDTLFAFFFLSSILSYQSYIGKNEDNHWYKTPVYWISVLLFILSMLSKPQAACLPVALLLFDWHQKEKLSNHAFINKIPFLVIAFFFGILALDQMIPSAGNHSLWDKTVLSSYATWLYLQKFFYPIPVSAHYPFPRQGDEGYPLMVYLSFFAVLVLSLVILFRAKKNKSLFFGYFFFLITLGLTLHFIKVNSGIIYDRFTYIPYIGLLFPLGIALDKWFKASKVVMGILTLCIIGSCVLISFDRCYDWKDSLTLWNATVEDVPESYMAYGMRANYWSEKGDKKKALRDYITCTEKNPKFASCQNNAGLILLQNQQFEESIPYFDRAHKNDPVTQWQALLNRAIANDALGNYDKAFADINIVLDKQPDNPMPRIFHAVLSEKLGRLDDALQDYNLLMSKEPNNAGLFNSRGLVFFKSGKVKEALDDYNRALALNPNYGEVYYRRSKVYFYLQLTNEAKIDAQKAQQLGFNVPIQYLQQLQLN